MTEKMQLLLLNKNDDTESIPTLNTQEMVVAKNRKSQVPCHMPGLIE
jgi:hypothetical protein